MLELAVVQIQDEMEHSLTLMLIATLCTLYNETCGSSNSSTSEGKKDIDNYIYGMSYSRDQVLSYKGDGEDSVPVRNEGKLDENNNFIVITRVRKTAQNGEADIGVVSANVHLTYPGALLLANQRLIDNAPDQLAIDRAPLTYTVNLPGLMTWGHFTIIPSFAEYQAAKEKALKVWFDKDKKTHEVEANFQSDQSFAYSKDLLRVKFGLEFQNSLVESSIDFDSMTNHKKLILIYKFKQIFYTVSVEAPKNPSDLFGPRVTIAELKEKTDSSNPPVIVDSVSYGRTIYVKLETSSTDLEAKAAISNMVSLFHISNKDDLNITKQLKDINMQVFVVGGSVDEVRLINAQSFKEVNEVIVQNGKFSSENLGYPVSYSAQFIKDNSRAVVQMTTDYIETTRTIHQKGIIKLVHTGWFVMQWAVNWTEVSYNEDGEKEEKKKSWGGNYKDVTAPFSQEIELPGNTNDIHVLAKECTFLAWEWWRTVIDRSGIPLVNIRKFKVWGTTLNPHYSIVPDV